MIASSGAQASEASRPRVRAVSSKTSLGQDGTRQPNGTIPVSQFMPGEAAGIGKGRTPT